LLIDKDRYEGHISAHLEYIRKFLKGHIKDNFELLERKILGEI